MTQKKKAEALSTEPPRHPVSGRIICGAHSRQSGQPCLQSPLKGKTRCKFHGGRVPKKTENPNVGAPIGSTNGAKSGSIYSEFFTEEEREYEKTIEIGNLENEIKLTRIRLRRFVRREAEIAEAERAGHSDGTELDAVTENFGGNGISPDTVKVYKRKDYSSEIRSLTARLESLERTHRELTTKEDDGTTKLSITVSRARKVED